GSPHVCLPYLETLADGNGDRGERVVDDPGSVVVTVCLSVETQGGQITAQQDDRTWIGIADEVPSPGQLRAVAVCFRDGAALACQSCTGNVPVVDRAAEGQGGGGMGEGVSPAVLEAAGRFDVPQRLCAVVQHGCGVFP